MLMCWLLYMYCCNGVISTSSNYYGFREQILSNIYCLVINVRYIYVCFHLVKSILSNAQCDLVWD